MKYQTILPLLLLSLAASFAAPAPAQTLPTVIVATVPSSPAPGDMVVLRLSGQWPDGCVPEASRTSLAQEGSLLRVTFNYSGYSGACTAVVTPWALDVSAGKLAAGTYTVEVTHLQTLMPAETIGTGAFTVAPLPEATVWLPGFSAPGATYLPRKHADGIQQHRQRGDRHLSRSVGRARSAHDAGPGGARGARLRHPRLPLAARGPARPDALPDAPRAASPCAPRSSGSRRFPRAHRRSPSRSAASSSPSSPRSSPPGRRRSPATSPSRRSSARAAPRRAAGSTSRSSTPEASRDVPRLGDLRGQRTRRGEPGSGVPGPGDVARPVQRALPRRPSGLRGRRRLVPDHWRPAVPRLHLDRSPGEPPRRPAVRDLPGARRPLSRPRGATRRDSSSPRTGAGRPAPVSVARPARVSPTGRRPQGRRRARKGEERRRETADDAKSSHRAARIAGGKGVPRVLGRRSRDTPPTRSDHRRRQGPERGHCCRDHISTLHYAVVRSPKAAPHRSLMLAGRGRAGASREPTSSTPRGPARVREDRAGIRPVRVFDERSEEFARAPRPAAADSEAGRARAAAAVRCTAPHAAPCRSDVSAKLFLPGPPVPRSPGPPAIRPGGVGRGAKAPLPPLSRPDPIPFRGCATTRCSAGRPPASPSGRPPRSRRRRGTRGGPRADRGRGSDPGCGGRY